MKVKELKAQLKDLKGDDDIYLIAVLSSTMHGSIDEDTCFMLATEDDLRADLEEYMLETCDDEDEEQEIIDEIEEMDTNDLLDRLAEFKNYMVLDL
jgi:hypothetical protein